MWPLRGTHSPLPLCGPSEGPDPLPPMWPLRGTHSPPYVALRETHSPLCGLSEGPTPPYVASQRAPLPSPPLCGLSEGPNPPYVALRETHSPLCGLSEGPTPPYVASQRDPLRLESIMLKIFVIILFQNSSQTYYYSIEILCYYAHIMLKNSIISTLFGKQQQSVLVFTQRQLYCSCIEASM